MIEKVKIDMDRLAWIDLYKPGTLPVEKMLAHDIQKLSKTDDGNNFLIHIAAPLAHHGLLMKNENLPPKEVEAANKIREVSHAFLSALVELLYQCPGSDTATLVNELGSPTQRKPQWD